jgi:hypothetical protein
LSRTHRFLFHAAVACAVLGPGVAAAQPGGATAMAEALFQQARELVKQGNYRDACPKLAESQRLDPKLGTLLNLAVCHDKEGKIATAWAEFTSAAAIAHREGQREREGFAREQIAALEKKLARVIVQVSAPDADLRITLDDQPITGAALGTPLPIDPGKHRIAASAPKKTTWSKDLDVPAAHAEILVPIPALEAAPEPAPGPSVPPEPPPTAAPPAPPAPTAIVPPLAATAPVPAPAPATSTPSILMGVGFGVGGAGLLVGVITGAVTLANASSIRNHCSGNQCTADQQGPIDSATTIANVSNVGFALGAVGIAVGVAGVALRPSQQAPKTGVRITPIVGPGAVGLRGSF